jgi:hypothetical protein
VRKKKEGEQKFQHIGLSDERRKKRKDIMI